MDKMQAEEMRDFLSQKMIYEEIGVILMAIYYSVRGYSVKTNKQFCKKKKELLPGSFKTMCEQ